MSTRSYASRASLLLLLVVSVSAQSCQNYPLADPLPSSNYSGICAGVIDYSVFLPPNATIPLVETSLAQLAQLASLRSSFPQCANAYSAWACSASFPRCASGRPQFPCRSLCEEAVAACTQPFTLIQKQALIPNCVAIPKVNISYPDTNCVDKTVVGNWSYVGPEIDLSKSPLFANGCPEPFVLTPNDVLAKLDPETKKKCFGPCCAPCPFVHALYPPGSMALVNDILTYVRIASASLAFFVLLSYMTLPGYQVKPRDLILYLAASIFIWQATVFFGVGDIKRVQCVDKFTAATQQTNRLCAAQGSLILFGVYSVILWAVCLILNLHLHLVWKKNWIDRYMPFIRVFCVIVPLGVAIVPLIFGFINYEFGTVCFITQKQSNFYFFYPLAAIIFPMFLVHMVTFIVIMRSTFKAVSSTGGTTSGGRSFSQSHGQSYSQSASAVQSATTVRSAKRQAVVTGIRMQWRPITLAFIISAIFIIFWLFQVLQLSRVLGLDPSSTEWVQKWIACLFQNLATKSSSTPFNACQNIILPEIPTFAFAVTVDVAVSTAGIWLFLIFGFRAELFIDWGNFIRGGCCCGARKRKNREKLKKSLERNAEEIRTYAFVQDSTPPSFPDAYRLSNYPPPSRNASKVDLYQQKNSSRPDMHQQNRSDFYQQSDIGSRYDEYDSRYDGSDYGGRYGAWEENNNSTAQIVSYPGFTESKSSLGPNRR